MCFGKISRGHSTELPYAMKEQGFLRTPHAIPRPSFSFHKDAVQVAFGENHWAVVTAGGGLFTAGDNFWGQLGRGHYSYHGISPLENVLHTRVSSVACGRHHTLVVLSPHTAPGEQSVQQVWGCGCNTDHQLSAEGWSSKSNLFPLNISKVTGAAGCDVPEFFGGACPLDSILRIAAGDQFSVVSVNDVVAMKGNGYPRLPGSPPGPRWVEFLIPADSAAALPWHGSPIKHLVAAREHVLIGCVCDRRLRVWGWGSNSGRQLGFPDFTEVFDKPEEIVYDCPQQATDTFPSMLAASERSSMIMVNGQVWAMGQHECENFEPTLEEPSFFFSTVMHVKAIDPQFFDNRPIAYVGTGSLHAAFVTTCGRLYVRGCSATHLYSKFTKRDNCLPTSSRTTKQGMIGVCEKQCLPHPRMVPCELLGNRPCGLVRQPLARKLAFLMGTHARLRVKDGAAATRGGFDTASLDTLVLRLIMDMFDALLPALVCP